MSFRLYSTNPHSEGAAALAKAMGIMRIKHENSKFIGGPSKKVINWGATEVPSEVAKSQIINRPVAIRLASNKLNFFTHIEAHGSDAIVTPYWTTNRQEAQGWSHEGKKVCVRATVTGHSAAGLTVLNAGDNVPQAPLYTAYVPKKAEFRVHMMHGEIIDTQQKVLRADFDKERANFEIRSHDNGFIFQRHGIRIPDVVHQQAQLVMDCLPLDFGAIDIIWNEKNNKAYVLEVNTAPGLAPETCATYAESFQRFYG